MRIRTEPGRGGGRGSAQQRAIQVVQFRLGDITAFLPARAVQSLGTPAADAGEEGGASYPIAAIDAPHVSQVLGLEPAPGDDGERFLLLVTANPACPLVVRVDGPVAFRRLEPSDLLRMPVGLERINEGPVVAVTEEGGTLGFILDPTRLLKILQGAGVRTQGGVGARAPV